MIFSIANAPGLKEMSKKERKLFLASHMPRLGFGYLFLCVIFSFIFSLVCMGLTIKNPEFADYATWVFYIGFVLSYYVGYMVVMNAVVVRRVKKILSQDIQ